MRRQRGFSLVELVAVLMLIAIVAGTAALSISGSLAGAKIRAAVRDLTAALRQTRGLAIVKGEERSLEIDVEARTYQVPGKNPVQLPEELQMKLLTAATEQTGDSKGMIRFFPDGSSSGGRVTLTRDRHEWRVEIAWLTGEVRIEEDR
ncbi:MAG: GspH/FimT family pseudopilin [Xanthomonadales bacterium]|nr:GspH/FimT family pseudopilin [Xanthomonadales bacterium]MBK7144161.1 GspH/FimT family pseudopilin [Xanthomonadales bacterium]